MLYFLEISHCCFQQWKNFQTRLTVDEVIAKSSTPRFLKHCSVESKKCVLWLRNCFFYTKSKNWSRCDRFWMYCMLPCSSLLNSAWFFVTFFLFRRGGGGCFNSENTPLPPLVTSLLHCGLDCIISSPTVLSHRARATGCWRTDGRTYVRTVHRALCYGLRFGTCQISIHCQCGRTDNSGAIWDGLRWVRLGRAAGSRVSPPLNWVCGRRMLRCIREQVLIQSRRLPCPPLLCPRILYYAASHLSLSRRCACGRHASSPSSTYM